jgi:hypothetical protein
VAIPRAILEKTSGALSRVQARPALAKEGPARRHDLHLGCELPIRS